VKRILIVGHKVRGESDRQYLEKALKDFEFLGFMDYDPQVIEADLENVSPGGDGGQGQGGGGGDG
jgi:CO dehydrogenase maturation factor